MQKALVHFLSPWEMEDEKTHEIRRGWSLHFLAPYTETREGSSGYRSTKTSIRDDLVVAELRKLKLPCLAELVLEAKPGPDGKLMAVIAGVRNAVPVEVFNLRPTA